MPTRGISRRDLLRTAAWSAPTVALAVAVPAAAASLLPLTAQILTTSLRGPEGSHLYLRDGKFRQSTTNTDPTNTFVVQVVIQVLDSALASVPGVTVGIVADDTKDAEGNFLIGLYDWNEGEPTATFPESPVKQTVDPLVTDAAGSVRFKVSTATLGAGDVPLPRRGTIAVTLTKPGYVTSVATFLYAVFDG